jgi:2C-methyl-D-erythritol 2,4-cyclodiphosphate synthase
MVHVGIGYDIHALVAGRKLILGGVEIPHPKGLDGHSDADALMHAICDALLGALGEPDIGHFFPNTDPRWKNVPSKIFLEEAAKMKKRIAAALGIPEQQIGIKATTNEKLGFIGREEGIAAMAVAGVDLPEKVTGGR